MKKITNIFQSFAEGVAAGMLAALFLTFLLQIFSRYVLKSPLGWTVELTLTLWIWLVFWGNAFVVRHDDHVTFDVLYYAASVKIRRVFALIGAAAVAVGMAVSLLPTMDFVDFMQIKKSATLQISMRTIFSIYILFVVAVVVSSVWRFARIYRHGFSDEELKAAHHVSGDGA